MAGGYQSLSVRRGRASGWPVRTDYAEPLYIAELLPVGRAPVKGGAPLTGWPEGRQSPARSGSAGGDLNWRSRAWPDHALPFGGDDGIRKWYIVGEECWYMVSANTWYIVGEDSWYMVGANTWYIMPEDYWYIVVRGVTSRTATPGHIGSSVSGGHCRARFVRDDVDWWE